MRALAHLEVNGRCSGERLVIADDPHLPELRGLAGLEATPARQLATECGVEYGVERASVWRVHHRAENNWQNLVQPLSHVGGNAEPAAPVAPLQALCGLYQRGCDLDHQLRLLVRARHLDVSARLPHHFGERHPNSSAERGVPACSLGHGGLLALARPC